MTQAYLLSPIKELIKTAADSLEAFTSALLLSEGKGLLRLVTYHSLSDKVEDSAVVEVGQGPVGWVMREQRPLNISRFKQDARTLGIYKEDVKIKSFMAVPLPDETGVIMADSKTRLKFTEKHLNILNSFGTCAVYLLKKAREQVKTRLLLDLLLWDAEAEASFEERLKKLMGVLSFDTCLLLRRVHDTSFFKLESIIGQVLPSYAGSVKAKRFPLDAGVCGWIFRHGQDILLKAFGTDPKRSFLIEKDEELGQGRTVLGLFFPASKDQVFRLDHALVFKGDADTEVWPNELPMVLKGLLGKVLPWR